MSELEVINGIMSSLTVLANSGIYPDDIYQQVVTLFSAISSIFMMFTSTPENSPERQIYLELILKFINESKDSYKLYPRVTQLLGFIDDFIHVNYTAKLDLA